VIEDVSLIGYFSIAQMRNHKRRKNHKRALQGSFGNFVSFELFVVFFFYRCKSHSIVAGKGEGELEGSQSCSK